MLECVDSDLCFVQDKNNVINSLLQVGSGYGSSGLKINGSGSGGPKINGSGSYLKQWIYKIIFILNKI